MLFIEVDEFTISSTQCRKSAVSSAIPVPDFSIPVPDFSIIQPDLVILFDFQVKAEPRTISFAYLRLVFYFSNGNAVVYLSTCITKLVWTCFTALHGKTCSRTIFWYAFMFLHAIFKWKSYSPLMT